MGKVRRQRKADEATMVLVDAETMGDDAAAAKHGLSTRQIRRYRATAQECPDMAKEVLEKRRELSRGWLEAAKKARMEALERGLALARTSDNLRDVTGFLKIVHDAVLADEMLGSGDELDRRGDGLGGQEEAGREVQGIGSTTH